MAHPGHEKYDTEWVVITEWVTVPEAAKMLNRTGSRVRQMIAQGNFRRVATLGEKPLYLLDRSEIEELAQEMPDTPITVHR